MHARGTVQCIFNGEENLKNCPFSWDCVTPPEKGRATAIGNMYKNLVKIARGSGDILADRQTDTHRDVLITIIRQRCCGRSNYLVSPITYAQSISPLTVN